MAIDSNGNVGIGTTSPVYPLQVADATNGINGFMTPLSSGLWLGTLSTAGTDDIYIAPATTFRMIVKESGDVGIGTASPDERLSVNGNASKVGGGSWATFSDVRLKSDIMPYEAGLDEVLALQPIRYRYAQDNPIGITDEGEHVGFSAQQVEGVIPEAVSTNSKGYRMLENDPILWAMLNAIKEQQAQIETLRVKLASLSEQR